MFISCINKHLNETAGMDYICTKKTADTPGFRNMIENVYAHLNNMFIYYIQHIILRKSVQLCSMIDGNKDDSTL